MFKLPETNKGVSVTHLSNFANESEILASGSAKYAIKSIERKKKKNKNITYIELKEVE